MAMPLAKVSVGKPGCGAAHASYITRLSAIDPERKHLANHPEEERSSSISFHLQDPDSAAGLSVSRTISEHLSVPSLGAEGSIAGGQDRDADPIWTWNAPGYLTGERHGTRPEWARADNSDARGNTNQQRTDVPRSHEKLSLKEKIENIKLYFGSREEFERKQGGRTHYRIILSFDVPATNEQIRDLGNKFLKEVFPNAIGFGAIHRDTEHPHAHIYLHSRQINGRRIQLKNNDFKSIDEKWAKIYSEFAGDRSAYVEHLRKKEETRESEKLLGRHFPCSRVLASKMNRKKRC